uniref:Uncharacterized protein n=1 Tax=Cucumis melo TaxID=3656 RepID=A0A9I9DWM6_CUCME
MVRSNRPKLENAQHLLEKTQIPAASASKLRRRDGEEIFENLSDLNRTRTHRVDKRVVNQPAPSNSVLKHESGKVFIEGTLQGCMHQEFEHVEFEIEDKDVRAIVVLLTELR